MPYLIDVTPGERGHGIDAGGSAGGSQRIFFLHCEETAIGCEQHQDRCIQVHGPGIGPRHCFVHKQDGVVTLVPCVPLNNLTYVDGQPVHEPVVLHNGNTVRLGSGTLLQFVYGPGSILEQEMMAFGNTDFTASGPMVAGFEHNELGLRIPSTEAKVDVHRPQAQPSLPQGHRYGPLGIEQSEMQQAKGQALVRTRAQQSPAQVRKKKTLQRLHAYELCLPVYVEVSSIAEEEFLDAVTSTPSDIPPSFSLGPAYTIYSACRFLLSSQGSCSLPSQQQQRRRHQHIAYLTEGAASRIEGTVQASGRDMMVSGFWMANTSELLHFLEQDGDLRPLTLPAQEMLSSAVHTAFSNLVECLKTELSVRLPVFLQDPQTLTAGAPQIGPVLSLLTEVMSMLRTFKTNPALLVQIFARVFTLIAGWLFNSLLSDVDLGLRSRYWATTLQRRLLPLARWAEGQGLERAAACHLAHIVQATELLTMRKYEVSDVREILVTCYRLNSLQMRALLETYQYAPDEPKIPQEVIEQVVSVTRDTTDAVWLSQQQEVSRLESLELRLPFLVPGDGYACEGLAAIPAGLHQFLQPLLLAGLCKLLPQPWTGTWTVFFSGDLDRRSAANSLSEVSVMMGEPEIVQINLQKRQGLGFSIVAAKGPRQANIGIYIKSIIKGGAADLDGRIARGDQLLSINGTSLIGISEKRAVEIMMKTGSVVALDIAKNAALFHNLADTLSHPTPLNNRVVRRTSRAARPKSESF
uniref:Afadin n=1 Tax=Petromyzon marinus TaxID=7757 RepID=S4RUY7_PETMA